MLGRWLQRDPAGYVDGLSLYAYVDGRPVAMVDPMGLEGFWSDFASGAYGLFCGTSDLDPWRDAQSELDRRLRDRLQSACDDRSRASLEMQLRENAEGRKAVVAAEWAVHQAQADAWMAVGTVASFGMTAPFAAGLRATLAAAEVGNAGLSFYQGNNGDGAMRLGFSLLPGVAHAVRGCGRSIRSIGFAAEEIADGRAVVGTVDDVAEVQIRIAKAESRGGTYILRDPETGHVMRTGRTNDLLRRQSEHARDPRFKDFEFEIAHRTDNYAAMRGLEQELVSCPRDSRA